MVGHVRADFSSSMPSPDLPEARIAEMPTQGVPQRFERIDAEQVLQWHADRKAPWCRLLGPEKGIEQGLMDTARGVREMLDSLLNLVARHGNAPRTVSIDPVISGRRRESVFLLREQTGLGV